MNWIKFAQVGVSILLIVAILLQNRGAGLGSAFGFSATFLIFSTASTLTIALKLEGFGLRTPLEPIIILPLRDFLSPFPILDSLIDG